VLLIDDVRTTGATLAEATKTLRAREHEVISLALAWAPGDPG
jgi:predicted amidophosphoribosyltransferase